MTGVAALVAAAGGVEFPREVDAYSSGVAVFAELGTDIDTTIGRHFYVASVEDVVGKDVYSKALVFEELATQSEIYSTCSLRL